MITRSRLIEIGLRSGAYILTFATPNGEDTVVADEVILAQPFSILRTIDYSTAGFDYLKKIAIEKLGYGMNTKLTLQFDERLWNTKGAGVSATEISIRIFFFRTPGTRHVVFRALPAS